MNIRQIINAFGGGKPRRLAFPVAAVIGIAVLATLAGCKVGKGSGDGQLQVSSGAFRFDCRVWPPPESISGFLSGCKIGIGTTWNVALTPEEIANVVNSGFYEGFVTDNVTMVNGTYSATFALYDQSGNFLGSYNTNIYVTGNSAYLSNPGAVTSWIETYASEARSLKLSSAVPYSVTNPDASSGQVAGTTYMDNLPVVLATSAFSIVGPQCHHTQSGRRCKPAYGG